MVPSKLYCILIYFVKVAEVENYIMRNFII
jgi:hypothetical protein